MHGKVIQSTGSWYTVRTDDGRALTCKVKGNFRLRGLRTTNPVAVGDGVEVIEQKAGEAAYIVNIDERRNCIIRKASNLSKQSQILATNLDAALLIITLKHPVTTTTFIDRFLASAEAYQVPTLLAFNKTDLLTTESEQEQLQYLCHVYNACGYKTFLLSATRGTGLDELSAHITGKTTLLAGHSGVGKSTLINHFVPTANARTAKVSEAHETGMHTTTFSKLYELPTGGSLIDVPGIKGFGTFEMEREEVGHFFRDIFKISADCRFTNCTHTHEPGCAVRAALDAHLLAPSRYASYLSMLDDKDESKYRPAY